MIKMFKSGLTKQGQKLLVAHTVHTPELNKVKTCLTEIHYQGGLKSVFSK